MEVFTAIALLCQATPAIGALSKYYTVQDVRHEQVECQQYYVRCLGDLLIDNTRASTKRLAECIMARKD